MLSVWRAWREWMDVCFCDGDPAEPRSGVWQ